MRVCKVDGCATKARTLGYCARHYGQIWQYGEIRGSPSYTRLSPQEFVVSGDTCEIILRNRLGDEKGRAIVDIDDFEKIKSYKWNLGEREYVYCHRIRKRLHQVVLGDSSRKRQIDHIDGNRLNNRKTNLRFCSNRENSRNSKIASNNTSGYKGVSKGKTIGTWDASIQCAKNKHKYLGRFKNKKHAAYAYNEAAVKYFGEFARLNDVFSRPRLRDERM